MLRGNLIESCMISHTCRIYTGKLKPTVCYRNPAAFHVVFSMNVVMMSTSKLTGPGAHRVFETLLSLLFDCKKVNPNHL